MQSFDPHVVAIAITTYYPLWYRGKLRSIRHTDKIRGDLALTFIKKVKAKRYQVVVVDGKSSRSFRRMLSDFKDIKVIKRRGLKRSPGRRQAFKVAAKLDNVKAILFTEAEKVSLIESIPQIIAPILKEKADIVVAKRNLALFKTTYPFYQYESEVEANKLYNENLRSHGLLSSRSEDLDMFFGPRAFKNDKRILNLFMRRFNFKLGSSSFPHDYFDPEEHSNTTYFPIVLALQKGLKIESVEIPFSYPELQKKNEEIGKRELFMEKRKSQKLGLLVELMHFISFLEKRPQSRSKP